MKRPSSRLFVCSLILMAFAAFGDTEEPRGCAENPTCTLVDTVPDDGEIAVELDPVGGCSSVSFVSVSASNASPSDTAGANAALSCPGIICTLVITQDAPGPATWEATIQNDGGGQATCGPFENGDGLPVDLQSFDVE